MRYDTIIVGAGIAGLTIAVRLLEKNPDTSILLLEKYNYTGGRIVTYRKDGHTWEIGAGRIASSHHRTHTLLRKYDLHTTPITHGIQNAFDSLRKTYLAPLAFLSSSVLESHTLADLLESIHGVANAKSFYRLFPYWGELHTLRADLALEVFQSHFAAKAHYSVCTEGYQALPEALKADIVKRGGIVQYDSEVTDIHERGDTVYVNIKGKPSFFANRVIFAIHSDALRRIPFARRHMSALRHLKMEPLVRMYATFPLKGGKSWFADKGVVVSDTPIRYFIPVGRDTCMISYTDGKDALYWIGLQKRKGDEAVQQAVMKGIRDLFPDTHIPDPLLFKIHPWSSGCTYWLPGHYDVKALSKASHCLTKRVFACGESISLQQAWVEGALESVETLLPLLA